MKKKVNEIITELETLINKNFKIFPCGANSKTPLEKDYAEKASNNPEIIRQWALKYPNCNWGMHLKNNGLIAVDIDPRNGGEDTWLELSLQHGFSDEKEWIQKTPSGGMHYIYSVPDFHHFKGALGKGIDIKHNGYILIPPSSIKGNAYTSNSGEIRNLPEWIFEKTIKVQKELTKEQKQENGVFSDEYLHFLVTQIKEKTSLSYGEWFGAICACKFSRGEEGFKYAVIATKNGSYKEGDLELLKSKWATISPNVAGGITEKYLEKILSDYNIDFDFSFEGERYRQEWFPYGIGLATKEIEYALKIVENEFAYINGKFYRKILNNGLWNLEVFSMSDMKFYFSDRVFIKQNKKGEWESINPIDLYKVYSKKIKYNEIFFGPENHSKKFNLFHSLPFSEYDENMEVGEINWEKCPPDIYTIIKSICDDNKEAMEWLLKWSAHIIKNPWEMVSTIPVLYGGQGTGKTLYTETILGGILGPYFCSLSADEISHRFNPDMSGKLLISVDEAFKGDHVAQSRIKKLSGNTSMRIEYKGGHIFHLPKYFRIIMTTNSANAVNIENSNRRFVVFSSSKPNAKIPWADIAKNIQQKETKINFFNFLKSIDLKDFNPNICRNFGMGEELKDNSGDTFDMFINDLEFESEEFYTKWFTQKDDGVGLLLQEMFYDFKRYCSENHVRNFMNNKSFANRVKGSLFENLLFDVPYRKKIRVDDKVRWCYFFEGKKLDEILPSIFSFCSS